MICSTYATFESMHGVKSYRPELIDRLRQFSRESVISLCSFIGFVLKLWEPGAYNLERYDHLISCAFDPLRGDWYKLAARLQQPELVFHRRQLLLEYKSSMFSAETKYSGNISLLVREVEKKLVRDDSEPTKKQKKGVEQLADAVIRLFRSEEKTVVGGLQLKGVTRVYPLLVTLDEIGGSLLISRLLNHYFDNFMVNRTANQVEVKPLLFTDVESIEEVSGCFAKLGLAGFLDYWLSKDPNYMATLTAFTVPGLEDHLNERMAREWHDLSNEISARAFPEEHKAASQGKNL